jgi:dihydropteroate synthase
MQRYYTRACNFYYGNQSKILVSKKKAIPLHQIKEISFDHIEIITRKSKKKISINQIKYLPNELKKKVNLDLKKIKTKKKNFSNLEFKKVPNILGVLNLTPDSFSDGGKFNSLNKAIKHSNQMINDGASVIDIGGESTRPGSKFIPIKVEINRVIKIISKLKKYNMSIDTRKSQVMIEAVKNGAKIINDVSALDFDKNSLSTVLKLRKPVILNHSQGTPDIMQNNPKYKNVLLDIYDYFEDKINQLTRLGFPKNYIILDPGIGFGKNLAHNLNLISNVGIFHTLGCPIMLGPSRKSFIGKIMKEKDSIDRLGGTLSAILTGYNQGVQFFRVHDIKQTYEALKVQEAINSI